MRIIYDGKGLLMPRQETVADRRSFASTMSTDDEGGGSGGCRVTMNHADVGKSPVDELPTPAIRTMLITANVGSVFEDPDLLLPTWQREMLDALSTNGPHFVTIHFQEVGGKNIHSGMVATVENFAKELVSRAADLGFSKHLAYFDQDYSNLERFTALGSVYLAHDTVKDEDIQIYDFKTMTFSPFRSSQIRLDTSVTSTSDLTTVEKRKFPLHLFPDGRYSRKGFLRTRWRLRSAQVDLVNVHLFHDASNLVSFEAAPSIYCDYRRRALRHVLDHLEADAAGHGRRPFFIFGDFNFRLEGKAVLKKLTRGLSRVEGAGEGTSTTSLGESSQEPPSTEIKSSADCLQFLDGESEEVVLRVSKKEFRLSRPSLSETFSQRWEQWRRFDRELSAGDAGSRLVEMELNFPPTYPYVEDGGESTDASAYMETRVPAWCDRVLMSYTARDLIVDEDDDDDDDRGLSMGDTLQGTSSAEYNMIGRDSCMGDHKPVFLRFKLGSVSTEGELLSSSSAASQNPVPTITEMSPTSVRCPRVESPTYTDLLSGGGGGGGSGTGTAPCTRYVDIKEVSHIKLFKETTV